MSISSILGNVSAPKYLYNITFNLGGERTTLLPQVPISAADDEEKTIERVCLSDSIEGCLKAIGPSDRLLHLMAEMVVRRVDISKLDKELLCNYSYLFDNGYVMDALWTHEYWYLGPVEVERSIVTVMNYRYERCINWTVISADTVRSLAEKYCPEYVMFHGTSEEVYNGYASWLSENGQYDDYDSLWEDIVALPWAQALEFSDVELRY